MSVGMGRPRPGVLELGETPVGDQPASPPGVGIALTAGPAGGMRTAPLSCGHDGGGGVGADGAPGGVSVVLGLDGGQTGGFAGVFGATLPARGVAPAAPGVCHVGGGGSGGVLAPARSSLMRITTFGLCGDAMVAPASLMAPSCVRAMSW